MDRCTFSCGDLEVPLDIVVRDTSNNERSCTIKVSVSDPLGVCPEGEGSPLKPEEKVSLRLSRDAGADQVYIPGEDVAIALRLNRFGEGDVTAVRLVEQLPPGWSYAGLSGGLTPDTVPEVGASGELTFSWNNTPSFPVEFSYLTTAPASEEIQVFTGVARYDITDEIQVSNEAQTQLRRYQTIMALDREISPTAYTAGNTLDITISYRKYGTESPLVFGCVEYLPEGWVFQELRDGEGTPPEIFPVGNASDILEFAWLTPPAMPGSFTYRVAIPLDATGLGRIHGHGLYRFTDTQFETATVETVLPRI